MRSRLIFMVAVCLLPMPVVAQAIPGIAPGGRVRVWTSDIRKMTGRLEAVTSDSLVVQSEDTAAPVSIPVALLTRIEVSRGLMSRGESARRRGLWGAVIGAVPGAISLGFQHEQVGGGSGVAKAAALGAWSGGLFGGLIGTLVGAVHRGEKWERVR
jgi:hypothetical protein